MHTVSKINAKFFFIYMIYKNKNKEKYKSENNTVGFYSPLENPFFSAK